MSEFEEKYPENIKKYLLSKKSENYDLNSSQKNKLNELLGEHKLDRYSNIEYYNEISFVQNKFSLKCDEILSAFPITFFKNEFKSMIDNIDTEDYNLDDLMINYGYRISLDSHNQKKYEEWRNVLSKGTRKNILLSLHKTFLEDNYEIKITYKNEIYILEINSLSNIINSIKFTKINSSKKHIYVCVPDKTHSEITTTYTFEDEVNQLSETKTECLYYKLDYTKPYLDSNPIIVIQVDTEIIKIDKKSDYKEKNYETYNIEPNNLYSWGNKKYENNRGRKYNEEWSKKELSNGGYELKCHKFLDDGFGKKTTEDLGKKGDKDNNMEYEYTDTYIYNVTNGDELTTKIGFDKYNKWNCRNYRNKIKDFSHVENIASNTLDKMEWKEKWDEEKNIKICTKWGRSEDEEWEESWKETYNPDNDDRIKECYKKCKKLKDDKEWYETWTEKNNGKPNCEKTCYKMNKENGNKYENYWGNIIVNYLDNKRMNYVGYINNDKKDEYVNYTYENTNN